MRVLGEQELDAQLPRGGLKALLRLGCDFCLGLQKGYARQSGTNFLQQLQPLRSVLIASDSGHPRDVPTGLGEALNHSFAIFRRSAVYIDKILKGTKPDELPVELPTKFEFDINLKTAKAIGLTISPAIIDRADKVIE